MDVYEETLKEVEKIGNPSRGPIEETPLEIPAGHYF